MKKTPVFALALAALALSTGAEDASADVAVAKGTPLVSELGVRVGGYGFRETAEAQPMAEESTTGWEACRMNGLGVYAHRDYSRHIFFEGAFDTYFTEEFPTGQSQGTYDTPIDRVSGILSVAAGARFFPDAIISPYVQLGIGAELTRVRLPELGMEDTALLPMGFFGVGASLNLGERIRVGAAMRVNAMGYYDDDQFQTEMKAETELATQGQFFAQFAL